MKIQKIADLAFHEGTSEAEAIAAFLALRRLGIAQLTDVLVPAPSPAPITTAGEQRSSWKIAGPDSYIMKNAYVGCIIMQSIGGGCHIEKKKKAMFGKQYYTITLKYSTSYSKSDVERNFDRMTKTN